MLIFFITDKGKANFSTSFNTWKIKSKEKYLTIVWAIKEKTNNSMYLVTYLTGKMLTRWHIFISRLSMRALLFASLVLNPLNKLVL